MQKQSLQLGASWDSLCILIVISFTLKANTRRLYLISWRIITWHCDCSIRFHFVGTVVAWLSVYLKVDRLIQNYTDWAINNNLWLLLLSFACPSLSMYKGQHFWLCRQQTRWLYKSLQKRTGYISHSVCTVLPNRVPIHVRSSQSHFYLFM